MVSRAWLGPNYQISSQVNVVKPGGEAQSAHRDYHLGTKAAPPLTLSSQAAHQATLSSCFACSRRLFG